MAFILASASPRRRELLEQAGIMPESIIPAAINETPHKGELPEFYVKRMAREKAEAVSAALPILAADTIVACGRRILGKPLDENEARNFLTLLSGRRHRVYTAVALRNGDRLKETCVMTQVQFKRLQEGDIEWYIATGEWQDRAGGYAIQGHAARFVKAIHGSYTNVVGLPLLETCNLLESL